MTSKIFRSALLFALMACLWLAALQLRCQLRQLGAKRLPALAMLRSERSPFAAPLRGQRRSFCGFARVKSIPISPITSTTTGWTWAPGFVPAEIPFAFSGSAS